jgi:large subunit ribosomal protein L21
MYAIVKTGGKQYKVAPGDKVVVEKLPVEAGETVELEAICIVDGSTVIADPAKAAATKVEAVVLEQFKGKKQLVFKFKKRKNYKKLRGHRQQLTKLQIVAVGSEKFEAPKKTETKAKAEAKADDSAKEE